MIGRECIGLGGFQLMEAQRANTMNAEPRDLLCSVEKGFAILIMGFVLRCMNNMESVTKKLWNMSTCTVE